MKAFPVSFLSYVAHALTRKKLSALSEEMLKLTQAIARSGQPWVSAQQTGDEVANSFIVSIAGSVCAVPRAAPTGLLCAVVRAVGSGPAAGERHC